MRNQQDSVSNAYIDASFFLICATIVPLREWQTKFTGVLHQQQIDHHNYHTKAGDAFQFLGKCCPTGPQRRYKHPEELLSSSIEQEDHPNNQSALRQFPTDRIAAILTSSLT